MRRVSRQLCEDGPLLEEQETEGQRQLHSLLLQQLHTDVDIDRCVAKRKCFAPASLYQPFGQQAAGVRSLSQFQALQDGEKELAGLRELGLTDTEIQLWQRRDEPLEAEKVHGVCAAPGAKQQRLQVITDKMEAREELMSRPQRFASSRPLSRREMEIERALFQGTDRLGFLAALYHRDEENPESQQGAPSSDPMDSLFRDVLGRNRKNASPQDRETAAHLSTHRNTPDQSQDSHRDNSQSQDSHRNTPDQSQDSHRDNSQSQDSHRNTPDQSQDSHRDNSQSQVSHRDSNQSQGSHRDSNQSQDSRRDNSHSQDSHRDSNQSQDSRRDNSHSQDSHRDSNQSQDSHRDSNQSQDSRRDSNQSHEASDYISELQSDKSVSVQSEWSSEPAEQHLAQEDSPAAAAPPRINISQPIGSLKARSGGPLTVRGEIQTISEEDILKNRESEEGIQNIPRFRNYQPGKPSKVLCVKNLSARASLAQLVALFSRYEQQSAPPLLYRLLTGRMKGQAFITLPDAETAQKALQLVHGYRLLGKPLVVEFGRERQEDEKQKEKQEERK
ncbi:RNA-binding protein 41 [Pseudochaenichthys georgianus]|uniref:RNA-binding protein 41 n=1 Tax=Pseudochaenichthys georgianus TaxID=52239 RepID=UPI0039C4C23E